MAAVHPAELHTWTGEDADRLYRLVADSIPQLVWATAPDGNADYFNSRLLAYTGLSADQLAGQGWREIIHADDRERVFAAWNEAARAGERYAIECRLRRADGAHRWHHVSALPFRARDGRVVRWFGTCTEIEDQVRNARLLETAVEERTRALRTSEALKSAILDAALDAIITIDHHGRIVEFNPAAETCFRLSRREAIGRSMSEVIVPPQLRARHSEGLRRYLATGESRILGTRLEMPALRADGSRFDSELTIVRIPGSEPPVFTGTLRDITERRRAEQALRESEQRFQLFLEHLPANAWIRDADFRYTYFNRRYAAAWGFEPGTLIGRDASELFPPATAEYFRESDCKVAREGAPVEYIDSVPAGRWLKMKFPVPDGRGGVGVAGIALDITERSRLEHALRESEQRFRSFMEHAPAAAWIKDSSLRYTYVNRTYESVYGRPATDVLGRDDFDLHASELARFYREEDEKLIGSSEAAQRMHTLPYADGRVGHWLVVKFPLRDAEGRPGVAGMAIDATPRLEAEEKARRYAEEVRSLVGRLVQAQEAERRKVAGELHDLIGQNLTALGIDLQALKQQLERAGDTIAAPRLDAMAALLNTTIDAVRGVMTDLRPVALEEFGLVPALRWYATQFSRRTGLKVTTRAPRRELRLAADAELALFRIAQEALTNAAKHSGGTAVEIRLRYGDGVMLTVQDDGRGFSARDGFGLTTMRERAQACGGTLRVESIGGTRVTVEIPVSSHGD
jgi:PAS domain S-box-containing protein